MLLIGLCYAGLQRFCMAMDIDIMSRSTFNALLQSLSDDYEKYTTAALEASRQKVHEYYISMDATLNQDSIIDLIVSYDGTYQKRGFTSHYGIGTVIEVIGNRLYSDIQLLQVM